MQKLKNVNQLKAGAILSYLSMGLGYLVSIVYTPLMLRLLGQSEYGLYSIVSSVVAYLGVLNFGFGSAYMRYYSRYKVKDDRERIASLNGMFLVIFSVIGLVAVIAGTVLALNTEIILGSKFTPDELSKAKILIMILVVNLAISFPNIVFNSHITANEKFIFQKIVQMIKVVANPFVVLPVLLMGFGSVGMVIATTFLNVLIEVLNLTFSIRKLKMRFSFSDFDFALMREMAAFSSFVFINLIIDQINWNIDKFIIGRFRGSVSVAVYGLAAELNNYYISVSTAISNVFVPRVHGLVSYSEGNDALTKLFARIGRIQFIILSLLSSGLIFFGRPFVNIWAGKNYNGSYPIVLLLILPGTVPLIQNIGIEIQRAKNMHQFRSIAYSCMALVNLALTIPLTKIYGGVGAAIGTAISLILANGIIMNWYYHTRIGLDIMYFWKQILSFVPAFIGPVLAGVLINKFIDLYKLTNFLAFGVIYVIIFSASMWFFGFNQYEKDLIARPVKRIIRFAVKS